MYRRKISAISVLLLVGATLLYPAEKKKEVPGEKSYKTYCLSCHGEKGKGDGPAAKSLKPPPPDFTKGKFKHGCSPSKIAKTIKEGVKGTAMAPWGQTLKEKQIKELADYILQKFVPKKIAKKCVKEEEEAKKNKK